MSPDRIVPMIPHTLPALAKPFGTPPLSSVDCFVRIRPMIPHDSGCTDSGCTDSDCTDPGCTDPGCTDSDCTDSGCMGSDHNHSVHMSCCLLSYP